MNSETGVQHLDYAADTGESWLKYIGVARIGLLTFVTLGAALLDPQIDRTYLAILYAFGFATGIWYLSRAQKHGKVSPRHTWGQVFVDFAIVAVTVAVTHGPTSLFTFIFVIVVLEAGLLLGMRQGFLFATLSSVFLLQQVFFPAGRAASMSTIETWYNFMVQCLSFYLTAFLSGYWYQRLYRMQQFQREILDNMNSGFLITDEHGIVRVLNDAAGQILNLKHGESVGRHVSIILRVASGGECPVVTALRSNSDFTSYEFRAETGQGETRLLGLTTNRMTSPEKNQTTGIIASFTDLTEMDEMRQEMRRQDRMAVVGELASGLAHEIRNPVAVIRGAVDELGAHANQNGGVFEKLCTIALRESDHLNEIVTGFLDFATQPKMKRESVDLRDLVEEVALLLRREYNGAGGTIIDLECPDDACFVSIDRSQIKQVFVNLGKNAIEAMNGRGHLWVRIAKREGPLEVLFEDEGPGIDPDKVSRIFEPFYTTKASGVGMGLAVCLRIVTAHDGTLRAYSREGGGCSMSVRLPAAVE